MGGGGSIGWASLRCSGQELGCFGRCQSGLDWTGLVSPELAEEGARKRNGGPRVKKVEEGESEGAREEERLFWRVCQLCLSEDDSRCEESYCLVQ